MDKAIVILLIILLIIFGILLISMVNPGGTGKAVSTPSYPTQQSGGGGCGR